MSNGKKSEHDRGSKDASEGRSLSKPWAKLFESHDDYDDRADAYEKGYHHGSGQKDASEGRAKQTFWKGIFESDEHYDQKQDSYDKGYDSASGSDSKDDSDSGCYLTSACVKGMGLSDDCFELNKLRAFRDNYVNNQPMGGEHIAEYYYIAPLVVDKLNSIPNPIEGYKRIYDELIEPCVRLIDAGKYSNAYKLYMGYTRELYAACLI